MLAASHSSLGERLLQEGHLGSCYGERSMHPASVNADSGNVVRNGLFIQILTFLEYLRIDIA